MSYVEALGSASVKNRYGRSEGAIGWIQGDSSPVLIVSTCIPGVCPGLNRPFLKTNQTSSVLLANPLLIWQEFRLDFIELLYRRVYLLHKGHII